MNENLFITAIIILSPLLILAWINLFYLIFNRRKDTNQDLSILSMASLYVFSLVPIGMFIGLHLRNQKIKVINDYKYTKNIRDNGNLILIISIFSTLFSLINLVK
jgi:hypothetical protein